MKIQPVVKQETLRIAAGSLIMTALMISVFLLTGHFDYTVLLGALLGAAAAVGNFFLLGLSVQNAAERMHGVSIPPAEQGEAEEAQEAEIPETAAAEIANAKRRMQLSYTGRMLLMIVIAVLGVALPCFHPIAAVLPLLFPRIVIFLQGFSKNKSKEA